MLDELGEIVGEQVKEYGQEMAAGKVEAHLIKSGMDARLAGFLGLGALILFIVIFA